MSDRRIFQTIVAVIVLAVALIAYTGIGTTTTQTACVKRGYPNFYVTWTLERYCIKRVNQTDIVARLDTLR